MAREAKEVVVQRIMKGLKCDRAEAEEVYLYDKQVDRDERTEYDLPPDKLKDAQKFAHAGTRKAPMIPNLTKRERKPNATKGGIIAEMGEFLATRSNFSVENLQITNKERQILFEIGGETYEITLVQKRKPKK